MRAILTNVAVIRAQYEVIAKMTPSSFIEKKIMICRYTARRANKVFVPMQKHSHANGPVNLDTGRKLSSISSYGKY